MKKLNPKIHNSAIKDKKSTENNIENNYIYNLALKPKTQDQQLEKFERNLQLVNPSLVRKRFLVYSSIPEQKKVIIFHKIADYMINVAIVGLLLASFSYAIAISLEYKVSKEMNQLEIQIKNREDLKSYVSKAYSWENLYTSAKKNHMVEVGQLEIANSPKAVFHLIEN